MKAGIPTKPMRRPFVEALRRLWPKLRFAFSLLLALSAVLTVFELNGVFGGDPLPPGYGWFTYPAETFLGMVLTYSPIVLAVVAATELTPARSAVRWIWIGVVVVLSCYLGAWLGFRFAPVTSAYEIAHGANVRRYLLSQGFMVCFPAALLLAIYEFHRRDLRALDDAFRVRAGRIVLDGALSRAQLELLRAQVEPHFLFNTLANLRRLYGLDPTAGRKLLHSLRRYLTAALPSLRAEWSSLRDEAALIGAYLDIFHVRMGARLSYEIAFPEELLDAAVPPMMLLTLVENAIKHGLAPLPEGGYLRLSAETDGSSLELRVSDSGRGMGEGSGWGTGLANIRARLAAAYGTAAELSLSLNRPRGVTALLRLPLQVSA